MTSLCIAHKKYSSISQIQPHYDAVPVGTAALNRTGVGKRHVCIESDCYRIVIDARTVLKIDIKLKRRLSVARGLCCKGDRVSSGGKASGVVIQSRLRIYCLNECPVTTDVVNTAGVPHLIDIVLSDDIR